MTLYQEFAIHYDDIFPASEETAAFLSNKFKKGKTLDLGCATGEYSLALSRKGFETLGIDIDANMIELAMQKNKKLSLLARFLLGNCLDVVYKNQFVNIFCIGNTLVHLNSFEEIKSSLKHIFESLKVDGTFVLQILNYDRILEKEVKSLPTLKNKGVSFVRKLTYDGEKIHFFTTLKTKSEEFENETLLYPITSSPLIDLLQELGYRDLEVLDGFSDNPFSSKESYQLVIVAKK
jgi:2-polyprenyl-3-methyl-5-hydroxy-6-metoxy-1,4-benzoquinol methylase